MYGSAINYFFKGDVEVLLESLKSIHDLRKLDKTQLNDLAREVREYIIDVISENGGHLASSLGVVDLTLALHCVFNTPKDKIIWDVGHQCYAHKIITGRYRDFRTIRKFRGISGFPKRAESPFDSFNTGHSSTSLSLALGEAVGRDLKKEKYKIVVVIGDGSMTGGMAFEALNQIGHLKNDMIIILNDNEHSISKNVGALSEYLIRMITGSLYNRLRKRSYEVIRRIPRYGNSIYDFLYRMEASLKGILIPGHLFEELGIRYFGPVDGHNIESMIDILGRIKSINTGPKILHIITRKGKGYKPAEMDPARFHGIGPFNREDGTQKGRGGLSYSEIVGKTLAELSRHDKRVVGITAAMKLGTGLHEFEKRAPKRFFDVGIAEQHAITFAGALASKGFKPFVSIYSTFLQRALDQLIHDVAIMDMPVRLLIDRAGIVGDDGETHHGLFDISMIRSIPNFVFLAPSSGRELRDMIYFAADYDKGPIAIRYPRGSVDVDSISFEEHSRFEPGRIRVVKNGTDLAVFALGDMLEKALSLREFLEPEGISVGVADLRTIKPLDVRGIEKMILKSKYFITMENGYIQGGVGEYILGSIRRDLRERCLFSAGFPDEFITHGKVQELYEAYGLGNRDLMAKILSVFHQKHAYQKRTKVRRISH